MGARWGHVRVEQVDVEDQRELAVGSHLHVRARVRLDQVKPEEVAVELYQGPLDTTGQIVEGRSDAMTCLGGENGLYNFSGEFACLRSGRHGFALRVVPKHDHLAHRYDTGLVHWG